MRSAWFWGTKMWAEYLAAYHLMRPEPESYKSSPLASDHAFEFGIGYDMVQHQTQVIDLTVPLDELWRGVRKSYRPLINKALRDYTFQPASLADYHKLHVQDAGRETRAQGTWDCMEAWMTNGYGGIVAAWQSGVMMAGAYFILYHGAAYYASGASLVDNVQHAVIWTAMKRLKDASIGLLELGQIDGETEKESSIGVFKKGFGGKVMPFTVATRRIT